MAAFFVIWFRRQREGPEWGGWSQDGNQFVMREDGERHADECVEADPELEAVVLPHGERPLLGKGRPPGPQDIERALTLVRNALWLWVTLVILGGLFHA